MKTERELKNDIITYKAGIIYDERDIEKIQDKIKVKEGWIKEAEDQLAGFNTDLVTEEELVTEAKRLTINQD